jgi:hypothetical protein
LRSCCYSHLLPLRAGPTYPIALTIVHLDGTSILSLHIGDLRRDDFWLLKTMDQGRTAQGKSIRSDSRTSWTEGWETAEVGSACLFEKPRSGARKMPRLSDITDDDDDHAYNADCDSGARNAMKNRCQPDSDDDSAYYTDDGRSEPKATWQRQPRASYVIALSHTGSVQPVRKLTDDWNEIRDLSYNLVFEVLRLVLIISLTVVRIGAAFMESVGKRFDKGMPRALGYKGSRQSFTEERRDFTGLTKEFTGRTDCLTDVRKRRMPDSTSSTSNSQETPQTQQAAMATMFYMPMPPPGTLGSPMFEGANVTEFLERYEDLCSDYKVSEEDKLTRLPRYCIQPVAETIKSLKEWKAKDYSALKKALLSEYRNDDTRQLLYSVPFLENYKNIARTENDDIMDYCQKFDRIAQHCIEKKVLTKYAAGVWFIHGLPLSTASGLIRKFAIDTEDPATVDYQRDLKHVMQQTASDKAIQQMNATRKLSKQQTEVVDQIIRQLRPTVSVTKEQRLAEPVVKTMEPATRLETTAVDQLTKAFEKLSVNLLQQAQTH